MCEARNTKADIVQRIPKAIHGISVLLPEQFHPIISQKLWCLAVYGVVSCIPALSQSSDSRKLDSFGVKL